MTEQNTTLSPPTPAVPAITDIFTSTWIFSKQTKTYQVTTAGKNGEKKKIYFKIFLNMIYNMVVKTINQ